MLVPISMGTNTAAGNRKKTSGVHFCQKRGLFSLLNIRNFRQMFLLTVTLYRMLKISGRVILKCTGQLWHGRPPDVTHNETSEIETLLISKKMHDNPGCIPCTSHAEDTPRVSKFHAKRPPKRLSQENVMPTFCRL